MHLKEREMERGRGGKPTFSCLISPRGCTPNGELGEKVREKERESIMQTPFYLVSLSRLPPTLPSLLPVRSPPPPQPPALRGSPPPSLRKDGRRRRGGERREESLSQERAKREREREREREKWVLSFRLHRLRESARIGKGSPFLKREKERERGKVE